MSPSGEKQSPDDPSTERILCQALNVMTSDSPSYNLTSDVNIKKIAKKRRGAFGTVDVEYTKSSKEYLQKAQESLRQDPCHGCINSSTEFSSSSSTSNPYGYEDPDAQTTRNSSTSNPYDYEDPDAQTTTNEPVSNDYGYEDPDSTPIGPAQRSFSQPNLPSSSDPYGYGDSEAPSGSQYGYEDPDSAPTIRRRGPARRRGSVTKFSIQAAAVATAQSDRILKKTNLLHQKGVFSSDDPTGPGERPVRCSTMTANYEISANDEVERSPRRSGGLLTNSRSRFYRNGVEDDKNREISPGSSSDKSFRSDIKPITPRRQPSLGSRRSLYDESGSGKTEDCGYRDHVSKKALDSNVAHEQNSNPYGYGEATPLERPQSRPRARRRGSVTKFSLEAQAKVLTTESVDPEPVQTSLGPEIEISLNDEPMMDSTLGPEIETVLNDVAVPGGTEYQEKMIDQRRFRDRQRSYKVQEPVSRWSPPVQDQAFGHRAPQRTPSIPKKKKFLAQNSSNSTIDSTLGPEIETSLNDVGEAGSRRSKMVQDQAFGHRVPQRTSSNQYKKMFLSQNSSNSIARAAARLRKEGEGSVHDSVESGNSCDDDSSFQPPRGAKAPSRSTSWRRAYSRSNSMGSVGTVGSDCDSLASDMVSLCSISIRTDDPPGALSPAASFKKSIVSRTPSKVGRTNSNGSLRGESRSTGGFTEDEDEEESVSALKTLNLENSKQSSFGLSTTSSVKQSVCRSYSGERMRTLRDHH
eukprot:scaffold794_cov131-Cylindrotheca_fusiformis.AAC.2